MNTPNHNNLLHTLCFDVSVFAAFLLTRQLALKKFIRECRYPRALSILSFETKSYGFSPEIINRFYLPRFAIYEFLSLATSYLIPDKFSYMTPLPKTLLIFLTFLNKIPKSLPFVLGMGLVGCSFKYFVTK